MLDLSLPVRNAIKSALETYAPLTGLVSATSIYFEQPKSQPVMPFIRIGNMTSESFEATCWDGSTHPFIVHGFARGPQSRAVLEIGAEIVKAMQAIDLDPYGIEDLQWVGNQTIRDTDEANAWHVICQFTLTAVEIA